MTKEEYENKLSTVWSGSEAHKVAEEYIASLEAELELCEKVHMSVHDELQELKIGVVAEMTMDGMTINDICSSVEVDDYSRYVVRFTEISEKKQ